MKTKPVAVWLFAATSLALTLGTGGVWASLCDIGGRYARKDGAEISVSSSFEYRNGSRVANARVWAFGSIAPDGAPRERTLDGQLELSRDGCAGIVANDEMRCKMVLVFTNKAVQAHQIGSCFTATGVMADGIYQRQPAPDDPENSR